MTPSAAGLKAVPAHGKVFYIDSGVTPKVDAAYVGYRIENSSGATKTGLWVSIESFIGGKLSLANPLDQYQQMDPITNTNYKTAFYLLKAIGSTTAAQTHTVKVFDRRPDLSGATAVLTCDFTFSQIQETIKANANKVTSVTGALSPTTATLGGTLTVSVAGDTGKVGAGKNPDLSIIWVSPAAVSTWPTRSLRLESTSVTLRCTSGSDITLVDTLIRSTADACFTNASGTWTGSYVFRIIGPGPSSLAPSPVANIASGTQYKHSDISTLSFGSGINLSGVATSAFTVNVTATSAEVSSSSSSVRIRYTITLSTTSTTAVEVDEVIDRAAAGTTYVAGSSTLNGSGTSDPTYLASETGLTTPPGHYIGPFSVVSGTNVVITFLRDIPCSNVSTPYSNTAYAKTGDQILGSATTTIPGVTVTTLTSGASSCGVTITNNPQTISPTVQTSAATSVTSSSAVLNGYANAYGGSGVTTFFKYSTDRNLVLSVTNTSAVSLTGSANEVRTASISSLSPGTTYYFQAVVTSSAATSYGATLSFTTDFVQAVPSVITTAATAVTTTAATLNGVVNPNLTSITKVQFIFGITSASVSDNSSTEDCTSSNNSYPCVVQVDGGTGSLVNLTLSGSGQTAVSFDTNSLTSGVVYYYKLQVLCTSNATYCPGGSVSGSILQFKTGAPQVTTTDATLVAETTATLNGSMSSTGTNIKHQFYYCAAAAGCTASALSGGSTVGTSDFVANPFNSTITHNLTGLTGNTTYYYQTQGMVGTDIVSFGEILSFRTILITTSSLPGGTLGSSYTTGLSGSGGVGPYSWTSTSLPAGLTLSSSGVISGTPTSGGTTSVTFTMLDEYYGTTTTKALNIVVKASITYALNGGTGTLPTEVDHASGETFAVAASTGITKTGYTFAGWNDGSATFLAGATYTMGTSNKTLTAQWTINTYTLSYNGNGYTSGDTPTAVTQNYNTTISVSTNSGSLAKVVSGVTYTFNGWNTAANGSGTNYAEGATFTFTENRVLYARWTAPGSKTVTFNSNFGTPITSSQSSDTSTALTSNSFTRTGYTFSGWGTDSSTATVNYANNATFDFLADTTLYAKWTINSYTLTYVAGANGGIAYGGSTGTPKTQSINYLGNGSSVVATPNTGYSFTSWNDGNTNATRTDLSITQSDTYTASFAINSYLITFNANGGSGGSSVSLNYNADAIPSKPSDPTRSGYTFVGWSLDGNTPLLSSYTVTGAATLLAIWNSDAAVYTITYGTTSSDGGTAPGNTTGNGSVTLATNSGNLTRSGYTFNGWNTATNCSGTSYSSGGAFNLTASVTLYPCWSQNSSTSSPTVDPTPPPPPPPAPVYVPLPPTITKISAGEVCAVGSQLVITGTDLLLATATVGGASAQVISASLTQMTISLPTQPIGIKAVVVRNAAGFASTSIEYKFVESPIYVNFIYPSTYQDMAFTYTFTATNTEKYSIDGVMPAGLTLNPLTGEISGTPTKAGNYLFTIVASNFCDQTYLDVYMFIDKAIPQTYTCSVPFLSPRSDAVSEFRLTQLRKCLDDIYTLSPATVAPVIFISGGLRSGLTIEQSLTHPRYVPILNLITSMNLNAQIYLGAFSGALDAVQLNIYWPMP